MAKGVKTGGRQKGSKNKVTVEREAEIAAAGLILLEFFLQILRNENNPFDDRFKSAVAAAPYCHPKLSPIEQGRDNDNGAVTIVRLTDLVDSAAGDNAPVDLRGPHAVRLPKGSTTH